MKAFWKSRPVKTVGILAALLVLGMLIAAATGHGETAQSGVLGTVFAPAHWAAEKISDGLATLSGNAKGNTEYEKKIDELQRQLGAHRQYRWALFYFVHAEIWAISPICKHIFRRFAVDLPIKCVL